MKKRRRRIRLFWRILLSLVVLIVLAGAFLWYHATSAPEWYAPPDPDDAQVAEYAERVEYRLVEEYQKIRQEEEPWTMRLDDGQLNAWLAARLPEWTAHEKDFHWPAGFGVPQVHVEEDGINLAIEIEAAGQSGVLVTRLAPRIVDGQIRLEVSRVGMGRVTLPGEPARALADLLEELAPGQDLGGGGARNLLGVLSGNHAVEARMGLADGRLVELLHVQLGDGTIELTNRTLPAGR